MRIKGVLFDLDNTLYDYEFVHNIALDKVLGKLTKLTDLDKNKLKNIFFQARKDVKAKLGKTASSHNRILYFQRISEILNLNSLIYALELYKIYWNAFLNNIRLEKDAISILNYLAKYKMCFITDMTAVIQFEKIKKLDLGKYFCCIVTSEEVGVEKPHNKMFDKALIKLKLSPAEVIMIGDDYNKDIVGASKMGIRAYWLNRNKQNGNLAQNVFMFKNFSELMRLFYEHNI